MSSPTFNRPDNIHSALQFNADTGLPELRVTLGSESITITGSVNVGTIVEVSSTPENPVHTHVSEIGTSGILSVPYMPSGIVDSTGHINDNTHPLYVELTSSNSISVTQASSPWIISGNTNATIVGTPTVNIGTIPEVEIKNDSGNPITVTGNVTTTSSGTTNVSFDSSFIDAFGRLRTSEPYTLFETHERYYDHNKFNYQSTNGGTYTYDANSSSFLLNVTAAAGSSVLRESYKVFAYQPGKSLLILKSFCMASSQPNLTQRTGFYGEKNGIYFEVLGDTLNMVIRSFSTGSLVETRIQQSQWNVDKMDGSGGPDNPSGINLVTDRNQILFIDVEWLGSGTVRCGFVINGKFYTAHAFHHANIIGNNITYMTTATLPLRSEIFSTGILTGNASFREICSTVLSEGGFELLGTTQFAGTGINTYRLTNLGVYYPIVSIRLNSNRLDSVVLPRQVDILSPTVNSYRWVLLLNPVLTGATWGNISQTGTVEYDLSATGLSGGLEVQSGYVSSRELSTFNSVDIFQNQLGRSLSGVSDIITLAISSSTNNSNILGQIGWQELT